MEEEAKFAEVEAQLLDIIVSEIQYQLSCYTANHTEDSDDLINSKLLIHNLPTISVSVDNCNLIYFDLETSGFNSDADILQIAAKFGDERINIYVNPTQPIDYWATKATGLENRNGNLFRHGKLVNSVPIKDALIWFQKFVNLSSEPCILVAHNVRFDSARLLRAIIDNSMIDCFSNIAGFSDSYILFKRRYPDRKGAGMFKLEKLAQDLLNVTPNGNFHEALYDVEILEGLVSSCIPMEDLIANCKSYREAAMVSLVTPYLMRLKDSVSSPLLRKLAVAGITYGTLKKIYAEAGEEGVRGFLSQPGTDNKPIVTKNKKALQKIIASLEDKAIN